MNTWIRRSYGSEGLTQYPVGPYIADIQKNFGGVVILCIDVSGSMSGSPLAKAIEGGKKFAKDAVRAHYEVGVIFWNHSVVDNLNPTRTVGKVDKFLRRAASSGGTDVNDALGIAHDQLRNKDRNLDRVVAIFGDGDLGNRDRAIAKAEIMRAEDIRILTLGLGDHAAQALDEISTETNHQPRTATPATIASSIALMAGGLRRKR